LLDSLLQEICGSQVVPITLHKQIKKNKKNALRAPEKEGQGKEGGG